ncbi:alpha/beta fold hydrolase [Jannaschia seohaensis]|uniref:Pimeloyl-ACP methyl ester carboxylesterase n=1 Tax=Jannaschia seohaensis TaxID=475081 RepID=A0A2Y9A2K7_9RHOB|nr:alpha/beta hydrolase [Jannaschia seohaensis]PWJ22396.1 pimeloyl-ACP methyl ester carboxylesterase [Jannaschia seohaensis]SSA38674.1 Pimeloyl-ACP methyl ester carboxylesterase [Jannaschia seohaensis]
MTNRTPLVLLPGMMCDARLFAPQMAGLANRSVTLGTVAGADSVPGIAEEVLAAAPARFALAGLSMGGIVAMEMMAQAPERIAGLCLMDTNPLAETEAVAARRAPQIESVQAGGLRAVMRDEMKPNYLADGPNRGAILDLCMTMAEGLGPEVFVAQSRALQTRLDRCETLRGVAVPSLVLCGEDDALCPLKRHTLMHELIPDSRLVVIAGAGHLPTLEQPEAVDAALTEWLRAVDAGEGGHGDAHPTDG